MAARKAKAAAEPVGRPSSFKQATADTICERIANGESLRTICTDKDMPEQRAVFRWLAKEENAEFRQQYARARETQADALFDEILNIADDGTNDWMLRNHGDDDPAWVENGEALRRSVLRVDARKWMVGKLQPKKYGDKLSIDHTLTLEEKLAALPD